jgi:hypothetical protein
MHTAVDVEVLCEIPVLLVVNVNIAVLWGVISCVVCQKGTYISQEPPASTLRVEE